MSALFCLAAANLAELTWHAGNMVELPNQTQQNIVPDPDGSPCTAFGVKEEADREEGVRLMLVNAFTLCVRPQRTVSFLLIGIGLRPPSHDMLVLRAFYGLPAECEWE